MNIPFLFVPSLLHHLHEHPTEICWILETALGKPGCSQTGFNDSAVRLSWKDGYAEEMILAPCTSRFLYVTSPRKKLFGLYEK